MEDSRPHTRSRILFSQYGLCSTNKTKFLGLKYKHNNTMYIDLVDPLLKKYALIQGEEVNSTMHYTHVKVSKLFGNVKPAY